MANEVTYTGSAANFRAAEVFNRVLHETLVDRTDIRRAISRLGDLSGAGATALETGTVAFNDPFAAANANETTAADNTALGNGQVTTTIAHQILSYGLSDLFMVTGAPGMLNLEMIAARMADAYTLRFTDLVCSLFTSVSATAGTSGADMTVDDWYDGIFALEQAVVPGPYSACIAPIQWTDLQSSLRGEGGANQYKPATAEALELKGPGFKGSLFGVDVFVADSVTTSGGNREGAMWGAGAFGYVEASPAGRMPGAIQAPVAPGSPIYAEFIRSGDPGISRVVGHAFVGVSIVENARAVGLNTDA